MKAHEIMVTDIQTIPMKTTVEEAVRKLHQNFGDESFLNAAPGLIVVNDRGELAGVFTPLTVITALLDSARHSGEPSQETEEFFALLCDNIKKRPVESVMEHQAISVTENAAVTDVADLFAKHRFQRIPVVRNKKVIGVIYRSRLLFAMAKKLLL